MSTETWTCWTTRTIADEWHEHKAALCLDRPLELGGEGCHRWEDESAAEYEMSSNGYLVYTGDAKARRRIPRDGAYCIVTVEFEASHTNTPEGDDWNWECYATDVRLATDLEVLTALQTGWYRHMKDAEVRQMAGCAHYGLNLNGKPGCMHYRRDSYNSLSDGNIAPGCARRMESNGLYRIS